MILRLSPDQCTAYWDDIKQAIEIALPSIADASADGLNEVLASLLNETSQAWAAVEGGGAVAIAITSIQQETVSKARNLLIYALAGYGNIQPHIWQDGFARIKQYAAGKGCRKIIAYSSVPRVWEIAQGLGADCATRLIEWEV